MRNFTSMPYNEEGYKQRRFDIFLDSGKKYSGLFGNFPSSNGRISSHLDNIRLKSSTNAYSMLLSTLCGQTTIILIRYFHDVITNEHCWPIRGLQTTARMWPSRTPHPAHGDLFVYGTSREINLYPAYINRLLVRYNKW